MTLPAHSIGVVYRALIASGIVMLGLSLPVGVVSIVAARATPFVSLGVLCGAAMLVVTLGTIALLGICAGRDATLGLALVGIGAGTHGDS